MTTASLPSPEQLKATLPLSEQGRSFLAASREAARRIVLGTDPRKALIVGPCSIHDPDSALDYARRLKELSREVEDTCYLVMRAYMEKPRTSTGWKGFLYDPHLDGTHAIETGLEWTRELLVQLAEMQIPCATEFVDPLASLYFDDLISWGFIGARTCSSQPHRQFASMHTMPIGFKNTTDGKIEGAIHGVLAARESHTALQVNGEGKLCAARSQGNPYAHIVLRGGCEHPNYGPSFVEGAIEQLKKSGIPGRLMIDCSHGNSQKRGEKQEEVFLAVLKQMEEGNDQILGMMVESHLEGGSQPLTEDPSTLKYAVSITDPCLDWKTTEKLIYSADRALSSVSAGVL